MHGGPCGPLASVILGKSRCGSQKGRIETTVSHLFNKHLLLPLKGPGVGEGAGWGEATEHCDPGSTLTVLKEILDGVRVTVRVTVDDPFTVSANLGLERRVLVFCPRVRKGDTRAGTHTLVARPRTSLTAT